ncbi:MAG: hypothetical protein RDV41_06880 [Planctomycetota bacterium]|nr:hypothetical protein [Planctomycetota bacterium]
MKRTFTGLVAVGAAGLVLAGCTFGGPGGYGSGYGVRRTYDSVQCSDSRAYSSGTLIARQECEQTVVVDNTNNITVVGGGDSYRYDDPSTVRKSGKTNTHSVSHTVIHNHDNSHDKTDNSRKQNGGNKKKDESSDPAGGSRRSDDHGNSGQGGAGGNKDDQDDKGQGGNDGKKEDKGSNGQGGGSKKNK